MGRDRPGLSASRWNRGENYLYDVGALTRGYDFQTLRNAGRITARAKAANADPTFSRRIRVGIPGMPQDGAP